MVFIRQDFIRYLAALTNLFSFGFGNSFPRDNRAIGVQPRLSGEATVIGAGTYPRATELAEGTLLGVYTAVSSGSNIITTVHSTDRGNSWQERGIVTSGFGDIDNPYLLQLKSGRVLCVFRNHSKDPNTHQYTFFRITICFSDDNGATWRYLSQPASDPGPINGNWEPFLRLSSYNPDNIQLYYSRKNAANDQDSLMRTSTDGGQTWSLATTISGAGLIARDGMLGVTTLPSGGGNLIAIFESYDTAPGGTGLFRVHSITSNDDGQTWGNRNTVYVPTGSQNNAGAPQITNVGGTLVVCLGTSGCLLRRLTNTCNRHLL